MTEFPIYKKEFYSFILPYQRYYTLNFSSKTIFSDLFSSLKLNQHEIHKICQIKMQYFLKNNFVLFQTNLTSSQPSSLLDHLSFLSSSTSSASTVMNGGFGNGGEHIDR